MMKITKPNPDGWAQCICPFHADNNPSASYNVYTGYFVCFGCGLKYNYEQLTKLLGYKVDRLGSHHVITKAGSILDWRSYYTKAFTTEHKYLLKRGISFRERSQYGIRHNNEGVMLPLTSYIASGPPIFHGLVVRRFNEKWGKYHYYIDDNKKPLCYPAKLKHVGGDLLVITEGVFGVINVRRHGLEAIATLGANVDDRFLEFVEALCQDRNIIVAFDDDYPGLSNALKIASVSSKIRMIVPGVEADEVSSKTLTNMIASAVPYHEAYKYYNHYLQDY